MKGDLEPMQVAIRIRPLSSGELGAGCVKCVRKIEGEPQVVVGNSGNTAFTYSYVFDDIDTQKGLYTRSVKPVLPKIFEGYNVTILAYGQTGSGKTYTMGTNCVASKSEEMGVIQRSMEDIFQRINAVEEEYDVRVSFLELYNETLYDLLTGSSREASVVELRENNQGMQIQGLCRRSVTNIEEAMQALMEGSSLRVTGATNMNAVSSRSHAVFTISVTGTSGNSSKFHLVDLAGSERAKKTGTAGDRFKEGISINKGLLALGNVISQLSEGTSFVNYRDSLLTRLLRDSLGGNSYTLMIACIGPADSNEDETLGTLRYADRVLKIKNKPIVNKDPLAALVEQLKRENAALKLSALSGGNNCPPSHALLEDELRAAMKENSYCALNLKQSMSLANTLQQRCLMMEDAMGSLKTKIAQLLPLVEKSSDDETSKTVVSLISAMQKEVKNLDSEMADHSKKMENMDEEPGNMEIMDEMTTRHIESNQQIEEVSKSLLLKEQLYNELTSYKSKYADVDSSSLERLEALVQQLMTEKAELVSKLGSEKHVKPTTKDYSIEAKNRLKQLEKELSQAQKRLSEQARIIKMKEKSDEKIKTLQEEMLHLKRLKVNLVHSMKAEYERFRALQNAKNKEVCKLRSLTNRQSNQINRIQKELVLKQAVWRRKLEAAEAAKKKMEAALAKRNLHCNTPFNKVAKVEEFIAAEVDLLESTIHAKQSVRKIMDDRAAVSQELMAVEAEIKQAKPGHETQSLERKRDLLKQDIDLQNAQIVDLQQQILDSEPESKRPRWEGICTIVEARHALNTLFTIFKHVKSELIQEQDALVELKSEYEEKLAEVEKLTSEVRKAKERERILKECDTQMYSMLTEETEPVNGTEYVEAEQTVHKSNVLQPIAVDNQNTMKPASEITYEDVFMSFVKNRSTSKENIPTTVGDNRRPSNILYYPSKKRPKVTFDFGITDENKADNLPSSSAANLKEDFNTTFIIESSDTK